MCGVPTIIGAPLGDLAHAHYDAQSYMWEHEASRLARTMVPLGDINLADPANWDLRLTPAELATADAVLAPVKERRILVAGVGTKMQAKDWGVEKWQALIHRMTNHFPEHALILVGAKDDRDLSGRVAKEWQGEHLNLCGQLQPRETAAVIRHSELFMGPDSGPMHFAASLGVPCAIAFSARGKPGIWYPYWEGHQVVYHKTDCFGCNLETCIEQRKKCLESIAVEEMFDAVMQAWRYGQAKRAVQFV
jgi:ADP-heptose:LPS heptosyltransferase